MPAGSPEQYLAGNPYVGKAFNTLRGIAPPFDPNQFRVPVQGVSMDSRVGAPVPQQEVQTDYAATPAPSAAPANPMESTIGRGFDNGMPPAPAGMDRSGIQGGKPDYSGFTPRAFNTTPQQPGGGYSQFRNLLGPAREWFQSRVPQSSRATDFANNFRSRLGGGDGTATIQPTTTPKKPTFGV